MDPEKNRVVDKGEMQNRSGGSKCPRAQNSLRGLHDPSRAFGTLFGALPVRLRSLLNRKEHEYGKQGGCLGVDLDAVEGADQEQAEEGKAGAVGIAGWAIAGLAGGTADKGEGDEGQRQRKPRQPERGCGLEDRVVCMGGISPTGGRVEALGEHMLVGPRLIAPNTDAGEGAFEGGLDRPPVEEQASAGVGGELLAFERPGDLGSAGLVAGLYLIADGQPGDGAAEEEDREEGAGCAEHLCSRLDAHKGSDEHEPDEPGSSEPCTTGAGGEDAQEGGP